MRPEAPVPGTARRSTLFSEAILRTSGEERRVSPVDADGAAAGRREQACWERQVRSWLRGSSAELRRHHQ